MARQHQCLLCKGYDTEFAFTYKGFDLYLPDPGDRASITDWYLCNGCKVMFRDAGYDAAAVYQNPTLYDAQYDRTGVEARYNKIMALAPEDSDNWQRVLRIKTFLKKKPYSQSRRPRMLDVGAGLGVFISRMRQQLPEFNPAALEINPVAAEFLENRLNIPTFRSYLQEIKDNRKFDLITFNRVIEHIDTPIDVLLAAKRLLEPFGWIYIELPDARTYEKEGASCPTFSSAHWMVYSPDAVTHLLGASGLTLEIMEQVKEPSGKWTVFCFASEYKPKKKNHA